MLPMEISLTVPDETSMALRRRPDEVVGEVRLAAAVKLYELGRLSSSVAAGLAGMPRPVFLSRLADYGVSTFRLSADELAEDLARA